jgi:hypothetical protein
MGRVLVACEFSGVVRRAFRALGHDAWSCDLLPAEDGGPHIQGDASDMLGFGWDLMVAHPPCTYLSRAGARWWKDPARMALADAAEAFVRLLWAAPIPRIAIENPIGQLNRRWRYPDQTVQPYEHGEPYSKATCLWLKGLPPLMPTNVLSKHEPLIISNASARKRAGLPARGRVHDAETASRTFPGIAAAMADQWGARLGWERMEGFAA